MVEFLEETEELENIKLRLVRENLTEIFVPDPYYYKKGRTDYLPATLPVWYNPKMEFNRDLTILSVLTYVKNYLDSENTVNYIEALGGTGVRGFRVFNELRVIKKLPINVIINDVNPHACRLMDFNRNRLGNGEIQIFCQEANLLLHKLRKELGFSLDIIEIDPYGSPMPFVSSTAQNLRGKGGLALITATDLAPLHGKHPSSALRKYGVWVVRNKFEAEVAVRALSYSIGREFSIFSKFFKPLLLISYDGFLKVIAASDKGKTKTNYFWEKVVFLKYDVEEPYRSEFVSLQGIPKADEKEFIYIGPIWGGNIADPEFCDNMLRELKETQLSPTSKRKIERFLRWLIDSSDIPLYLDLNDFGYIFDGQSPPIENVVNELRKKGFRCDRTYFNYNAIKIDAWGSRFGEVIEALFEISKLYKSTRQ